MVAIWPSYTPIYIHTINISYNIIIINLYIIANIPTYIAAIY